MRKLICVFAASILLIMTSAELLSAQDWSEIHPDGTNTLVDTAIIRSVVVRLEPGETIGPVTHPAHFAYILSGGKLRVDFQGKEPVVMNLEEGMSLYNNPEGPHRTTNIGKGAVSFLLVELKDYPYQKTAGKNE